MIDCQSEGRQTRWGTGSLCWLSYLLGFSQSEHLVGMGGRSWRSPSPLQKGTMDPKAETQPMLGGPQSPLYCCVGSTACISLRTLPHTSTGAIKKKGRKHPPACLRWSKKKGSLTLERRGKVCRIELPSYKAFTGRREAGKGSFASAKVWVC